jgi:methylmalonyl-CoA/ethylmalonyl-CoA epimerase
MRSREEWITHMESREPKRFAHVCLIVEDIQKAIADYTKILGVVDPKQVQEKIVYYDDFGIEGERLAFATFVSTGVNCEIQLMEPKTPGSPLFERLKKHGEHVHHLCFTSPVVDEVVEDLDAAGVGIVRQGISNDPNLPWQRWTFVDPAMSHGVLIELANTYESVEGQWEPAMEGSAG